MPTDSTPIIQAKERLDRLLAKSRAHMYKPIGVAEVLFRDRTERTLDLHDPSGYRRRAYEWCSQVCHELYGRRPVLNSRYWDQLFDAAVIPPEALAILGQENRKGKGVVEAYIYSRVVAKMSGIQSIVAHVQSCEPRDFDLGRFLALFEEDARFRRSADKAYEVVVYALFNALTKHLNAQVTLSVDPRSGLLADFEEFAKLVLGVDASTPSITKPARLFRVGTANAADAGLDMWANFGPAVQVKHLSLSPEACDSICDGVQADQIVIVCKRIEAANIEAVLSQVGLEQKIRGIVTEIQLENWYQIACGPKYRKTLGYDLLKCIVQELHLEFPLVNSSRADSFLQARGYKAIALHGRWQASP